MGKKQPTFEDSLAELEKLVAELESGELPLDAMMERYERGVKTLAACRAMLDEAEKKIEILIKGKDGTLETAPFEAEPGA